MFSRVHTAVARYLFFESLRVGGAPHSHALGGASEHLMQVYTEIE